MNGGCRSCPVRKCGAGVWGACSTWNPGLTLSVPTLRPELGPEAVLDFELCRSLTSDRGMRTTVDTWRTEGSGKLELWCRLQSSGPLHPYVCPPYLQVTAIRVHMVLVLGPTGWAPFPIAPAGATPRTSGCCPNPPRFPVGFR